ncbi:hypothetical protein DB347_25215 [Opitutaceae bacterium EW11]|nr:hypothetical protein DB347_25215 [Opitutaceae bacterium EW11]
MRENECYAYLRIIDFDCPPAEITGRIGVDPTATRTRGEPVKRGAHDRFVAQNEWQLRSRRPPTDDPELHIRDVVAQLQGREEAVREIAREHKVVMQCVGYFHHHDPGFSLDAVAIQGLARCGASLDLDYYHLYGSGEESA